MIPWFLCPPIQDKRTTQLSPRTGSLELWFLSPDMQDKGTTE